MRLLVTGGAGFIGSHFIRSWLANHPMDEVVNLDVLTYAGSLERLSDLSSNGRYRFIQGDICNPQVVQDAMRACDGVVHFAAETHVDRSITDCIPFLRTNVEGTSVMLQQARDSGVKRFITLSTDEVYGPVESAPVDEQAPLKPRSPYAASKAAGDLLTQAFYKTYGFSTIVVRPTNIFGPGQFPEKFIPLCITNGCEGRPIPIYGDGQQRRSWLFVEDACEALAVLIEHAAPGEVYNLASGTESVNRETGRQILSLMNQPETLLQSVPDRPGHDRRYAMNDAKLRALGWKPRTSFDEGLMQTVAWYRAHSAWWRPLIQRLREDPYHWLKWSVGTSPQQTSSALL